MSERCPLSDSPGLYFYENIPEVCHETCGELWEHAIRSSSPDHEEYPDYILSNPDCTHIATENGNSSLQNRSSESSVRIFSLTERCLSCDDEIAEDSFLFHCPNA